MRTLLLSVTATALLATGASAFAAVQQTSGTVLRLNVKRMTLTLIDGTRYHLPDTFKDPGIKVGERVKISWELEDHHRMAENVAIIPLQKHKLLPRRDAMPRDKPRQPNN